MTQPDRPELTCMMQDRFPRLRALNSANMRWKKFFYKQLCDRAEVFACRAPSCDQCSETSVCFGPELARVIGPTPGQAIQGTEGRGAGELS